MKIEAIQLGETLQVKKFLEKYKFSTLARDPNIINWGKEGFVVLFRYGVAVLWNLTNEERGKLIALVEPFLVNPLKNPLTEVAEWKQGKTTKVSDGIVQSTNLQIPYKQLIGVSLARTVVMDFFERKVDNLLQNFSKITDQFKKRGRSKLSSKELLKLAGAAMSINNQTVSQMAMLDKPDFIWDDPELDALFLELEEEYEISDRYAILNKKLETLMQDGTFIMNLIETRRSHLLELIIILLFVFDIVLLFWEKFTA